MVVHPPSHGIPRVPQYSGYLLLASAFKYGALTLCGRPSHAVLLASTHVMQIHTPKNIAVSEFSLFRVRSPLLAESRLISFPRPT